MGGADGEEQRVAVARRFCRRLGADVAVRSGAVLHHELLAEALRELLRQDASENVVRAARRLRHDDRHRAARIVLRANRARRSERKHGEQAADVLHGWVGNIVVFIRIKCRTAVE